MPSKYDVAEVVDRRRKRDVSESVLRALPGWFGIEASIVEYVRESQSMPFWAAYVGDRPVGFLALKRHNAYTSEIFCMGIRQEFHRQGIGSALVRVCEAFCTEHGSEFLTVKTLDESRPSEEYARTRAFYLAMGFGPLEVFKDLWDEANPCLLLAKSLTRAR